MKDQLEVTAGTGLDFVNRSFWEAIPWSGKLAGILWGLFFLGVFVLFFI